ncbi:MAG: glycerophosphodiester phosphodiesterase family protein [Gammaproteobacteria bacterium]
MNEAKGGADDHGPVERRMQSILIGHRGEPSSYPENSLAGFEAVLNAGAAFIETDVQLSADGVPVLCHDPNVMRLTGHDYVVMQTGYATLSRLPAGYPKRFGARFAGARLARLGELATLLKRWPLARAFVEVKQASILAFGTARVMDVILAELRDVLAQCIIISFQPDPLIHTRAVSSLPIGWVLPSWSNDARACAAKLRPEYLICSRKRLPVEPEPLWPGPWKWVVYTVNTMEEALALRNRGIDLLETDSILALLRDARLGGAEGD